MSLESLKEKYDLIKDSTDVSEIMEFKKSLLELTTEEAKEYHFSLLMEKKNKKFYYHLRNSFIKRGTEAEKFCLSKWDSEKDPRIKSDLLHILGRLRSPSALPLARGEINNNTPETLECACYVLGWMGELGQDADLISEVLIHDKDSQIRTTAATSHDQMRMNSEHLRDKLLLSLARAFSLEKDENVLGWIILTIQYFLGKRFGMHENIEEAELIGDVIEAKKRCARALSKLNLNYE